MTSTVTQASSGFLRAACRVLFGHPVVRWFNNIRRRRGLVIAYVLLLASFPTVTAMTNQLWAMVLLIPVAIASLLLGGVTDGLFDRPLGALDERQRHLRHTVLSNPYLTGASLGIAAGLVIAAALGSDRPAATGGSVALLMLVVTLPTIMLAWKLPAEVDDGE